MRAGQIVQEHWVPNKQAAHATDFQMEDYHGQAPSPALYFQAGRWLWCWWSDQFSRALRHKTLLMYFVSTKLCLVVKENSNDETVRVTCHTDWDILKTYRQDSLHIQYFAVEYAHMIHVRMCICRTKPQKETTKRFGVRSWSNCPVKSLQEGVLSDVVPSSKV